MALQPSSRARLAWLPAVPQHDSPPPGSSGPMTRSPSPLGKSELVLAAATPGLTNPLDAGGTRGVVGTCRRIVMLREMEFSTHTHECRVMILVRPTRMMSGGAWRLRLANARGRAIQAPHRQARSAARPPPPPPAHR